MNAPIATIADAPIGHSRARTLTAVVAATMVALGRPPRERLGHFVGAVLERPPVASLAHEISWADADELERRLAELRWNAM